MSPSPTGKFITREENGGTQQQSRKNRLRPSRKINSPTEGPYTPGSPCGGVLGSFIIKVWLIGLGWPLSLYFFVCGCALRGWMNGLGTRDRCSAVQRDFEKVQCKMLSCC